MSLINDVLCDLQSRQRPAAQPLAGLQPVRRSRRGRVSVLWLPIAALLLVASAWAWRNLPPRAPGAGSESAARSQTLPLPAMSAPAGPEAWPEASDSPAVEIAVERSAVATPLVFAYSLDMTAALERQPIRPATLPARTERPTLPPEPMVTTGEGRTVADRTFGPESAAATASGTPAEHAAPPVNRRREALSALETGRPEEAASWLRAALEQHPADAELWLMLCQALDLQGKPAAAEAALRAGLEHADAPSALAQRLARRLVDRGVTAEAITLLERHRPPANADPGHDAFLAALLQREGKHEAAVSLYSRLIQLDDANSTWWVGLAISQDALARRSQALAAYRRAVLAADLEATLATYARRRIAALQHDLDQRT